MALTALQSVRLAIGDAGSPVRLDDSDILALLAAAAENVNATVIPTLDAMLARAYQLPTRVSSGQESVSYEGLVARLLALRERLVDGGYIDPAVSSGSGVATSSASRQFTLTDRGDLEGLS